MQICRATSKVRVDFPDIDVEADQAAVATSSNVDLVVIASPNGSHTPLARAALMADKHVVVDKPFTLNVVEARSLLNIARRRGRMLTVFHNRRWDSDYLSVKQVIADRTVGVVKHFESHIDRFRPYVRDRWRERDEPGSGLWFDLGPHLVDQALQLFGLPDRVSANLARLRAGAQSDDWAHVVLDYPDLRVVLHASMIAAGGSPRFVVHGDAGSVVKHHADIQEQQLLTGLSPGAIGWGIDPDPLTVHERNGLTRTIPTLAGDQRLFYSGVVNALHGLAPNPVTPAQSLAVMACIEAAAKSAQTHKSVELQLDPEERAAWA